MKRFLSLSLVAMAVLACGSAVRGGVIPIPNGDFMSPDASALPYANPDIPVGSWQKAAMPAWWQNGATSWHQTTGVFYNVSGPTYITNLNSQQAAFMYAVKDAELFQELTATYEVGQSYHLNFGLIPSNVDTPYVGAIAQGTPISAVLYYREGGTRVTVASVAVANSPELDHHTLMSNFTVDSAVVQAGDAWAGKEIGIQFLSGADFTNMGGVWDIGNVALNSTAGVPEPASLGLLAAGAMLLLGRRRR